MNRHDSFVHRLAEAARRASLPEDSEPPPGFATRVVAGLTRKSAGAPWERLAWASVGVTAVLCIACLGWEQTAPRVSEDEIFAAQLAATPFQP
jgi:hypothetical protein